MQKSMYSSRIEIRNECDFYQNRRKNVQIMLNFLRNLSIIDLMKFESLQRNPNERIHKPCGMWNEDIVCEISALSVNPSYEFDSLCWIDTSNSAGSFGMIDWCNFFWDIRIYKVLKKKHDVHDDTSSNNTLLRTFLGKRRHTKRENRKNIHTPDRTLSFFTYLKRKKRVMVFLSPFSSFSSHFVLGKR